MRTTLAIAALVLTLAAGACSARLPVPPSPVAVSPRASTSAAPSPTPTASPTAGLIAPAFPPSIEPVASIPSGRLPTTAVAERDGVRIRVTLDRDPMPAGKVTWVTTELTNTGRDRISWMTDGCGIHVGVRGTLAHAKWRRGVVQFRFAGEFKRRVESQARIPDDRSIGIDLVPAAFVGRDFGCADVGINHSLGPGRTIRQRHQWDGLLYRYDAPAPTAELDLTATFRYWRRASDRGDQGRDPIEISIRAWIDGAESVPLSPGELADIALFDPTFHAWVDATGSNVWQTVLQRDPGAPLWRVGLAKSDGDTRVALVDPVAGSVVSVVKAWTNANGGVEVRP